MSKKRKSQKDSTSSGILQGIISISILHWLRIESYELNFWKYKFSRKINNLRNWQIDYVTDHFTLPVDVTIIVKRPDHEKIPY